MLDFNAKIQYYYCLTFKYRWGVQSHRGLTHQNFRCDVIVPFNQNLDHLFDGKVVQPWKEMRDSLAPSEHWTTVSPLWTLNHSEPPLNIEPQWLSSQHFAEQRANPYTADHFPIGSDLRSTMCYQQNGRQKWAIFKQQFL